MGLEKAIKYGKEKRKSFDGTNKAFSRMCRNHGGCDVCEGNRLFNTRKRLSRMEEQLEKEKDGSDPD